MNKIDEDERGDPAWDALYAAVRKVCLRFGKEDACGGADFWVVDDNWGDVTQKVCVTSPKFLTPEFVKAISQCVKEADIVGAKVILALDLNLPDSRLPPSAIVVTADTVVEEWDIDLLRHRIGNGFYR